MHGGEAVVIDEGQGAVGGGVDAGVGSGDGYKVRLDAFEGPLDLLLHLIRRAEVDIHDVPIALVAEQYMGYLGEIERIDIELAGEFLVMAATLVEIKSRLLQPRAEGSGEKDERIEEEGADPRAELIRQLLEFKKYRDASEMLDRRRRMWAERIPVGRVSPDRESLEEAVEAMGGIELEDVSIIDLMRAFEKIVEAVDFDRAGDHEIVDDDTPIELHAEDIVDRVRRDGVGGRMTLVKMFEARSRAEMLGLFLALLELLKEQRATARQEGAEGEIWIELRGDESGSLTGDV